MRIKEFQGILRRKKISKAILINSDGNPNSNFVYFAGVKDLIGVLVIPSSGQPVLYTTILEYGIAKKHSSIKKVVAAKKLADVLKENCRGKVGIDFSSTSVKAFNSLKKNQASFVDVSEDVSSLRIIKTPKEVSRIRKAASIASSIIGKAIKKANSRMAEKQLAHFINSEIFNLGLEQSFPTIVASGKNSCNPHHVPSNDKLRGFTVIDMGIIFNNYCSDITRTFYLGKPSKKELTDYQKVLQVQEESISLLKGFSPKGLNERAKKILGKTFVHSLGHGIGLDVHENPFSNYDKKYADNMVVAIEPGLYDKYGIRIEDDILVKKNPEILTKFTKKLIIK